MMDAANRMLLDLYRAAHTCAIADFQAQALRLLDATCRFDGAIWGVGEVVAGNELLCHAINLHDLSEMTPAALGMTGNPAEGIFESRYESRDFLCATARDKKTRMLHFIGLRRGRENEQRSQDDNQRCATLLPHVLEAGAINRLVALNHMTGNGIVRRGVRAIASTSGVLHAQDAEFTALLRTQWPDWTPPLLPAQLRAALVNSRERKFSAQRIVVCAALEAGMMFILAREKKGLAGLTPAQLAVARLIAIGHSYKKAAAELALSERTVRNHLTAAYARLALPNKAALAQWLNDRSS